MEILSRQDYTKLLDYLPTIKSALSEWQLVDIKLLEHNGKSASVHDILEIIARLFMDTEGRIYQCNDKEILMLARVGPEQETETVVEKIETAMPAGSCQAIAQNPTPEGLKKIEIFVTSKPVENTLLAQRAARRENIIMIADDDLYMRTLANIGLKGLANTIEVESGNDVLEAYKQHNPDVLLLDIHLPGKIGPDILKDILALDPDAYVIMLTADSSPTNIAHTTKLGAKGFMAKPFTKKTLQDQSQKCPTLSY